MERELILLKLERIEKHIFSLKTILTVDELSEYTGFKKSYIYKLVHQNLIPFSKPNGKVLFFEKIKIDTWLLGNSSSSKSEIESIAIHYAKSNKSK